MTVTDPLEIVVDYDKVTIEQQVVKRPMHIGVKQWLDAWEKMLRPPIPGS